MTKLSNEIQAGIIKKVQLDLTPTVVVTITRFALNEAKSLGMRDEASRKEFVYLYTRETIVRLRQLLKKIK